MPNASESSAAVSAKSGVTSSSQESKRGDTPMSQYANLEPSSVFNPGWRLYVAFCSLSVITLMAALDATSISVALPIMAEALHGSAIEAFWSGTSFLLTATVFQPILSSFSDVFGRKSIILFSLVLFGIGAIIAAVADNFTVVLVGRSIQGIGGGGIIVLSEVIITDLVPLRERGKYFSFISAMWALGTVVGPLLGGGFSEHVTWRWIFWINLPFIVIGSTLVIFFMKLHSRSSSLASRLMKVDWIGMVVFVASTTGFLIPITWGGVQYAWDSWRTLVPLVVCGAALVAFIIYEHNFAPNPLIRTRVFMNRTAASTFIQTILHGMVLWCELYYLPLYYEAAKGYSPILAGVALFPQTFTVAPAAMVVGFVIAKTGRYRWALWSGWFLMTFGMGLLIYLDVDTKVPSWVFLNLVPGLGAGILFPSMAITVQACSSSQDQAVAVTMFTFTRALGQTIGVAIGGVIFQNEIKKKLLTFPLLADKAVAYSRDASGLVQIIKAMPAGLAETHQLKVAYVYGLRYICMVMTGISAVAFVVSFFAEGLPLDRELESEQGFDYSHGGSGEAERELEEMMMKV